MKNKRFISQILIIAILLLAGFFLISNVVSTNEFSSIHAIKNIDNNADNELHEEKLKSLPYLTWVPIDEEDKLKTGVTIYNEDLSFKGINLYNSLDYKIAYLIDMKGNRIHNWSADTLGGWSHGEMSSDGYLFLISLQGERIIKLDWNSNIIWEAEMPFHHDLDFAENKDIYALTTVSNITKQYKSNKVSFSDTYFTIISPYGNIKKNISMFNILSKNFMTNEEILKRVYEDSKDPEYDGNYDLFHVNTVELINNDIKGIAKKGDILTSLVPYDLVLIIDREKEEVVWDYGRGVLGGQHQPTLLDNGNIMIFDNFGSGDSTSRIIEVNPRTKEIEWTYESPRNFYSATRGSNQRLPNGNTLITESDNGRVFEVTRNGTIVWEFFAPEMDENNDRRAIYRMTRLDPKLLSKLPFDKETIKYLRSNGYVK